MIAPARARRAASTRLTRGVPGAAWDGLDDSSAARAARGSRAPLPLDADPRGRRGCEGARRRVCRPDAAAYGAFVRALGRATRALPDENQGGGVLPRVDRWSFANEPNQPGWLQPQFARRGGITLRRAAVPTARWPPPACRRCAPPGTGATRSCSARRRRSAATRGRCARRPVAPGAFIRTLLCIDRRGAAAGAAAAVRGCARARAARVTRLRAPSLHARRLAAAADRGPSRDGDHDLLVRPPEAAARRRRRAAAGSRRRCRSTTPSTASRPTRPTALFGVSLARQAAYINQSDWIAYRDARVRTVAQYKLADDPAISSFQSGLRFCDAGQAGLRRLPAAALGRRARATRGCASTGQVRPRAPGTSAGSSSRTRRSAPATSDGGDDRRPGAERDLRAHAAPARGPVPAAMGQRALARGIDRRGLSGLLADRDVGDADGAIVLSVPGSTPNMKQAAVALEGCGRFVNSPMSSRLWSTLACGNFALICGIVAPMPTPFRLGAAADRDRPDLARIGQRVVDRARERRLEAAERVLDAADFAAGPEHADEALLAQRRGWRRA